MPTHDLVLGFHAIDRGFGWIVFESPLAPFDWGVVEKKKDRNAQCIFAIERILERYQPSVLAIESFDHGSSLRAARIKRLYRSILALAASRNIDVRVYTGSQIRAVFAEAGATTRYEIACTVAQHLDALRPRLQPQRHTWESEKPSMALFNAAAVALTHFAKNLDDEAA